MLPLAILSACAAVLVIPASAAPLPLDPSSELQQPAVVLIASPDQAFAADSLHASHAAPRDRVRRGADFRAADYAVRVATAVKTAIPTQATPAVLPAAAPTGAALSRRSGLTHGSGDNSRNEARATHNEVIVPAAYAATPPPVTLVDLSSVPQADSDSSAEQQLSQPSVDLAGFNTALVHPDTTPGGPGPETRPKFNQANPNQTLSQTQLNDGAPVTVPSQVDGSTALAQVGAAHIPVLTVSKAAGDAVPHVAGPGSDPNSYFYSSHPAVQYKIGTVNSTSRRDRRAPLRLSRRLSGSSVYPGSEPHSQPINLRAVVEKLAPRAALVENSNVLGPDMDTDSDSELEKRQNLAPNLAPNVPVDVLVPSARKSKSKSQASTPKARMGRAAFVKNLSARDMDMDVKLKRRQANFAPNVPVDVRVPSALVEARKARVSKAWKGAAPGGLNTNREMRAEDVGKLAEEVTPRLSVVA